EANEPKTLLEALKRGDFYSSQGPELRNVELADDHVRVACSSAATVIVQGQGSASTAVHGASMTKAEISLTRFANSPWIRVTIIDAAGKKAWSNPVWL
ncbi:MAG: phosphotransferase, partial [Pseudomonadota bacterium]